MGGSCRIRKHGVGGGLCILVWYNQRTDTELWEIIKTLVTLMTPLCGALPWVSHFYALGLERDDRWAPSFAAFTGEDTEAQYVMELVFRLRHLVPGPIHKALTLPTSLTSLALEELLPRPWFPLIKSWHWICSSGQDALCELPGH